MSRQKGDIMREVLISIQPKWVEKICRGEKTVEVRRTRPKCETPFKCYIYCTKGKPTFTQSAFCDDISNGKVIGEFVCDRIDEFVNFVPIYTLVQSCLTTEQIGEYLNGKRGYAWHITDLVVYDEPRELSEFYYHCRSDKGYSNIDCGGCPFYEATSVYTGWCVIGGYKPITRAPQSWQFCVATEPRQTAD
jgi:predicted transcriptional regulator